MIFCWLNFLIGTILQIFYRHSPESIVSCSVRLRALWCTGEIAYLQNKERKSNNYLWQLKKQYLLRYHAMKTTTKYSHMTMKPHDRMPLIWSERHMLLSYVGLTQGTRDLRNTLKPRSRIHRWRAIRPSGAFTIEGVSVKSLDWGISSHFPVRVERWPCIIVSGDVVYQPIMSWQDYSMFLYLWSILQ